MVRSADHGCPAPWPLASGLRSSLPPVAARRAPPQDKRDLVETGTTATDAPTGGPAKGGTLFLLTNAEGWGHVDPQRAYTGEDLAFFGGTTMRALTAYKFSPDETEGTSLVPDMATDLGTASNGGADVELHAPRRPHLAGRLGSHL